ncbi:MAG: multidrug efflux SMR transporter [Methylococcales bacterium]
MAWILLLAAGLAEIIFAVSLKYNAGFTRLIPSIITLIAGCASFYLLTLAIKVIPLGTAYAIWTGMGAIGVAVIGILMFNEAHEWTRLLSIFLVIVGILGLKLTHAG